MNKIRAGQQQRTWACSKPCIQHCCQGPGKQHGIAELVSNRKGKLEAVRQVIEEWESHKELSNV